MIELEDHLHVTFGEALVAPAHVVVTRPSSVHVTVEEVVQTPAAIRQLAEALCQSARVRATRWKAEALKRLILELARACWSSLWDVFFSAVLFSSGWPIVHRVIKVNIQASVDHLVPVRNAVRQQTICGGQGGRLLVCACLQGDMIEETKLEVKRGDD